MRRILMVVLVCGLICLLGLTPALAGGYNEAPMLRTMVAAGELPPVEKRLPEEPMVVGDGVQVSKECLDFEIGRYGGTLRTVFVGMGGGDWWSARKEQVLSQPSLGIPEKDSEGGICKGFKVSADGKVFTFFLRKGLKWSDGAPLTTEDIRFGYEDILQNEELTPIFPKWLTSGDKPGELEIIDDYKFRIRFAEPYGMFSQELSFRWRDYWEAGLYPAHYLKHFHSRYTPMEELRPLLEKAKLTEKEWAQYFLKNAWGTHGLGQGIIGVPSLSPYIIVDRPSPNVVITERNPYYWKVDSAGNQLPYIDRIRWERVSNLEILKMKVLAGEGQLVCEPTSSPTDVPLFKEGEKKGNYRAVLLNFHCPVAYMFNYSYPDKAWRKVIGDVRFRKALNLAITREEIIDSVYKGLAKPSYTIPSEYNLSKANELLDEMGLDKRDAEGWRLGPDGKRLELPIEISTPSLDIVPMTEIIVENWGKIGLKTMMKVEGGELLYTRDAANKVKIKWVWMDIPVTRHNLAMWVDWKAPAVGGVLYETWHNTGGKKGEEPPAEIKKVYELANEIRRNPSAGKRSELFKESMDWIHDRILFIMPVEDTISSLIVAKNLGNVPSKGDDITPSFVPEQLFFKE